ncbi:MAG: autoinducer binding domain-containing protein, partial [Parasphingopyxis sp.]|uniref:autoinducer binding domain-containing protein n=1 Tax=Parasphingopyxis sp. TaxID=1920299 RepID=UPI003F9F0AC8
MLAPSGPARTDAQCKAAFLRYVQDAGIEFCNYGTIYRDAENNAGTVLVDSNMPASWIEEYQYERLNERDYFLARAAQLSPQKRFDQFTFGDWLVPVLDERTLDAAPVLCGAADAG